MRVVRGSTLSVREEVYVMAARATGCSDARIIIHHVLPNIVGPLLVQSTVLLGHALLAEAGLSFLGLGLRPPAISWGVLLHSTDGLRQERRARGLDLYPRYYRAAVKVPEPLWQTRSQRSAAVQAAMVAFVAAGAIGVFEAPHPHKQSLLAGPHLIDQGHHVGF